MPARATQQTLDEYEELAVAHYFAHEVHFPYVSVTLTSLLAAWLMWDTVPTAHILLWLVLGTAANLAREWFVRRMRPHLDQGEGGQRIIRGFTVSAFLNGVTWGAFAWMYFDEQAPLTMVLVGAYLTGHVGGAVTPLSIHLPAFHAFLLPALLPCLLLLVRANTPTHYVVAGLTLMFLVSMAGYARLTNRLHRDAIRLRFENQRLISDLEERNAEVESASRNKSLFLAGVSHDLKQPIRAIAMYTGFLRHSAPRDGAPNVVTQTAEKIESAVSAIHGQIGRLLELSRLESGAMPLNLELLDLDDVFTSVHQLLAPQAQAQNVQLRWAFGRQREVWTDRRMLESILVNFISNAIKHTEGGRVYVGTRWRTGDPEGQRLCIEVRDSGSGIPAEQLPLLFDAYRSFDDRAASESHGLGLAIAKAQASYLGCDIAVRSQPGCGSTFTLCGLRTADTDADPRTPTAIRPEHP